MPALLEDYKKSSTLNPIKDNRYMNKETKSLDFLFSSWKNSNTKEDSNEISEDLIYSKSLWAAGVDKTKRTISIKQFIFDIPTKLSSIIEEIQHSEKILDLVDDWNGEASPKISEEIYFNSINFLINYSTFILDNTGIIIQSPEINPGKNGNVHLSWRTNRARMIVNISETNKGILAHYYGDLKNDTFPVKGHVPINKVSDYLAFWMKNLM